MEMQNLKETEMPLLARKRIKFELDHASSSTPTKTSNKATREARIRAYQEAKQAEAAIPVQTKPIIDSPVVPQPPSIAESRELSTSQVLNLTPEDLPWLKKAEKITLSEVVIPGSEHKKYYYGEAIRERLVQPASQLTPKQKGSIISLLSTHLPELVTRGFSSHAKLIVNRATERPIYYLGNIAGQRVYFMRMGNLDELPVIIQVAACDKAQQDEVLRVLTTKDRKDIKKFSKL